MNVHCFSITSWFNIFDKHNDILNSFQNFFQDEYSNYHVYNSSDNIFAPLIEATCPQSNMSFSKINFSYTIHDVLMKDLENFKSKVLNLYDLLTQSGVEILHSAIFANVEFASKDALKTITKKTISSKFCNDELIDITLKLGKKYEDLFYKIISILNKKQLKIPQKFDANGNLMPLPLTSWYGAKDDGEIIEISYEINDKYSFDFTKNYHTTEFYLNKMIYVFESDLESDIDLVIKKGEF